MAEEPALPPRLPPSLPPGGRRKRGRDGERSPSEPSTSSDPAVFSSDDDPALDNYQDHGRRKRRYVGTWFDQHPASSDSALGDDTDPVYPPPRRRNRAPSPSLSLSLSQPQKREFKRQLDSGVWMGTDGSLTDTDDDVDLELPAARLPLVPPSSPPPARPRFSLEEQAAQETILSCVEGGIEDVDLSGVGLENISEGLLEPISNIYPIPNVTKDVAFEQRDPQIKVFLFNNRLRVFPVALLNVEHLTVLSLRANNLVRIPPSIARLRNLETLNIAQNSLRFLPAELLELLQKGRKLRNLQFQPNPFWLPTTTSPSSGSAEEYEKRTFGRRPETTVELPWTGLTTRLQSRTPVQFTDSTHKVYSRFVLPPMDSAVPAGAALELEPFSELAAPKELRGGDGRLVEPRGARSLFELALRACVTSAQSRRIRAWLRDGDEWPAHFSRAVEQAAEIHAEGGAACSVCGRETLMPLARWIEFRQIGRTRVEVDADGVETSHFTGLGGESEGTGAVPEDRLLVAVRAGKGAGSTAGRGGRVTG